MNVWWTYDVSDFLMFAPSTWYRLFELHNLAWWPLQLVMMALACGLLWAISRRLRGALPLALALTGAALLFVAGAFFWQRLAQIHLAAPWFALAFAAQGLLLLIFALLRRHALGLGPPNAAGRVGIGLLAAAVFLYPACSLIWMRPMQQAEWIALAPDPTMLATLGVLLSLWRCEGLRRPGLTWLLLSIVPLAWCAITGATLWALAAPDWWLMPMAGALAILAAGWQATIRGPFYVGRRGHC